MFVSIIWKIWISKSCWIKSLWLSVLVVRVSFFWFLICCMSKVSVVMWKFFFFMCGSSWTVWIVFGLIKSKGFRWLLLLIAKILFVFCVRLSVLWLRLLTMSSCCSFVLGSFIVVRVVGWWNWKVWFGYGNCWISCLLDFRLWSVFYM